MRDAQGNVLSTYTHGSGPNTQEVYQDEVHLYGSSRLGTHRVALATLAAYNSTEPSVTVGTFKGLKRSFTRGNKFFELSNHLGNVLAVVSDRKVPVASANPALVARYTPVVVQAQDYSAFGMLMPQRSYTAPGAGYRYGFNGKENDNEVKGVPGSQQDYGMRIYDPRVGRFLSVDPLMHDFPWNSVYSFAEDDPINFIDLDGEEQQRPRNPGGAARPGIRGPLTNPGEIQAEGVLARVRLVRSQRVRQEDELHFRRMNNDPIYRTNYIRSQQFSLGAARQGYFQNAINSAQLVFSNGGVTQNKKLGDQWDNLVNTSMLKNPSPMAPVFRLSGPLVSIKSAGLCPDICMRLP